MPLKIPNITDAWNVRPILFQNLSRVIINFNLANASMACSLKPKVDSADTGK
jgi:hypothetical protein